MVRPFVGFVYGSGDGDPSDSKLHGFMTLPVRQGSEIKDNPFLGFLENSAAFYGGVTKDYTCPARAQGLRTSAPAGNPLAVGAAVLGGVQAWVSSVPIPGNKSLMISLGIRLIPGSTRPTPTRG